LVCFAIGALIPLVSYLAGADSLWLALAIGGVGLFVAGAVVGRFTARPWPMSGLRQLLLGALAAAATYGIGVLISAA
jgi:VIT1/CCC1 family predicted Fe2+/Mn2+ transporter